MNLIVTVKGDHAMKRVIALSCILSGCVTIYASESTNKFILDVKDQKRIALIVAELVKRRSDPEYNRRERAIDDYLLNHQYLNPMEVRAGGYSENRRREILRLEIQFGMKEIDSNGKLQRTRTNPFVLEPMSFNIHGNTKTESEDIRCLEIQLLGM